MSLKSRNQIYNNYNISYNMNSHIVEDEVSGTKNFKYRFKRLKNIIEKVKDIEEEIRVRDKKTKEYIKEKVNRRELANVLKQLYTLILVILL